MALVIAFDELDRDGKSYRRRQRINRTTPATDPTTITLALPPSVKTILDVDVQALTDGTAASAPRIQVFESAPNIKAKIETSADKVKALLTSISGF